MTKKQELEQAIEAFNQEKFRLQTKENLWNYLALTMFILIIAGEILVGYFIPGYATKEIAVLVIFLLIVAAACLIVNVAYFDPFYKELQKRGPMKKALEIIEELEKQ